MHSFIIVRRFHETGLNRNSVGIPRSWLRG
jgi:hypothetical protein